MVSWSDAKKPQKNDRKEIIRVELPTGSGEIRLRLTGDVIPRQVYWVVTKEGKKFPLECLSFNRDTESFDNSDDPIKEIPEAVYNEKPGFAYVCQAFQRGKGNEARIFDLKKTIYSQIIEFARNPEFGNPADPDSGYDLTIKKEKTGPLPQNVRYTVTPARSNSPLTEEERAVDLFDLSKMYKRQTYAEQKAWLLENTTYFAGQAGDDFQESAEDLK
jgi:hypothetical protein